MALLRQYREESRIRLIELYQPQSLPGIELSLNGGVFRSDAFSLL
jgi:hypothetical protein